MARSESGQRLERLSRFNRAEIKTQGQPIRFLERRSVKNTRRIGSAKAGIGDNKRDDCQRDEKEKSGSERGKDYAIGLSEQDRNNGA